MRICGPYLVIGYSVKGPRGEDYRVVSMILVKMTSFDNDGYSVFAGPILRVDDCFFQISAKRSACHRVPLVPADSGLLLWHAEQALGVLFQLEDQVDDVHWC